MAPLTSLMLVALPLLVMIPSQVGGAVSGLGVCAPFQFNNGDGGGSSSNLATIQSAGDLALVAWDPATKEQGVKCLVLKFDSSSKLYNVRWLDKTGNKKNASSNYVVNQYTLPIFNNKESNFVLNNLPNTDLNLGTLYPVTTIGNEFVMSACNQEFLNRVETRYVFVPLAKAIANKACNCPDWKTA
ncbi:uncharacterized protein LOC108678854 [Hyalella azteca]|uniref:Uncharacterized protein LOC108678854 n=1 Tax=Hyalella azteca TaxID=294128 RepID=A0A8B7PA31_HYAAZ|nr:uncharacterized protein LOC108678854 [Hyalella azteca]